MAALTYPVRAKDSFAISSNLGLLDNRGLKLNISGMPASLMTQAIAVLRRLGGTLIGLPDDYGLVLGPELVTNGGWAVGTSGGTSSASNSSGVLSLSGDGTNFGYADQSFSVVAGRKYKLTFSTAGFTINVLCGNTPAGTQVLPDTNYAANTTHTVVLTAASAALWLRFQRTATGTTSVSNISVREILSAQSFIDSTGTQPVTAVGNLVGLTLDRMGTVGPELRSGAVIANTGSPPLAGTYDASTGVATVSRTDAANRCDLRITGTTINKSYLVVVQSTSGAVVQVRTAEGANMVATVNSGAYVSCVVIPVTTNTISIVPSSNGTSATFTLVSCKELTGNHATQATTASKPLVAQLANGSKCLDFDGSNDLLTLGSGAILQQGSDHFVTAAFVLDGTFAVQQSIYTCSSSASTTPLVCDLEVTATTGQIQAFWRDDSNTARTITGAALQIGVPYVATAALIGTTRYLWLNGVLVGTNVQGALGATTVNTANIGALVRTSTTNYLNGKLIDIAICQSTLTDADRRTIERAMAQKAGITL